MGVGTKRLFAFLLLLSLAITAHLAAQSGRRKWAMYEYEMQDPVDDPPDAAYQGEYTFARLRYRSPRDGGPYARWGIDANKSDRLFLVALKRLTRLDTSPIETIIDIESDDIYNWPWLFAVSVGDWSLTPDHAERLRMYFERGGFLMVDDFHGDRDWAGFMNGISRVIPNARVVELENDEQIFHVLYHLNDRVQIPGQNVVHGRGYEKDGVYPHWRGILDEQGRVVVAICFNMDVGDAWEFADDPDYPEKFSSQAMRLGINYVLYSMTH